jgi:hypothetical protein
MFPSKEATGGVLHWEELRNAPPNLRALMRAYDAQFCVVENDAMLSDEGKRAKKREIGRKLQADLAKFKGMPEAVTRRMTGLNEKMAEELSKGKSEYAEEIRAWVAKSDKPILTAMRLKDDRRAAYALLSAPHYLSGLSADEQETLRKQFFANTSPGKEAAEIEAALGVCDSAVKYAEFMVMERAQICADGSDALSSKIET